MRPTSLPRALVLAPAILLGCDGAPASVAPAGARECPPCECTCDCGGGTPAQAGGQAGAQGGGQAGGQGGGGFGGLLGGGADVGELVASASRKMMHDDGQGCLDDLDQVAAADPAMDARLAVNRGQCEMLVGRCQEGKERIARWYEQETAMTPGRAAIMAEQLGSMRCRGGDSSDRDRLLRALFELTDGAYVNQRDAAWCKERIATIRELVPRVPPRDADDTQVSGGAQALFHTGAACLVRAEDCHGAFATYHALFPDALSSITDARERKRIVRESFDGSFERCKGRG